MLHYTLLYIILHRGGASPIITSQHSLTLYFNSTSGTSKMGAKRAWRNVWPPSKRCPPHWPPNSKILEAPTMNHGKSESESECFVRSVSTRRTICFTCLWLTLCPSDVIVSCTSCMLMSPSPSRSHIANATRIAAHTNAHRVLSLSLSLLLSLRTD